MSSDTPSTWTPNCSSNGLNSPSDPSMRSAFVPDESSSGSTSASRDLAASSGRTSSEYDARDGLTTDDDDLLLAEQVAGDPDDVLEVSPLHAAPRVLRSPSSSSVSTRTSTPPPPNLQIAVRRSVRVDLTKVPEILPSGGQHGGRRHDQMLGDEQSIGETAAIALGSCCRGHLRTFPACAPCSPERLLAGSACVPQPSSRGCRLDPPNRRRAVERNQALPRPALS